MTVQHLKASGGLPCPECGSLLDIKEVAKTCVGYLSPPGHNHDDNCNSYHIECENGHGYVYSMRNRCHAPGCDWVGKATCFCHAGLKLEEDPFETGCFEGVVPVRRRR